MQFSEPNLVLNLGSSYNERGVGGAVYVAATALDQRKVNSIYEPVKNAATGQVMLYLAKRPGTQIGGTYGTSGQVAYLVHNGANLYGPGNANYWVFSTSGDDIRASNSAAATTVVATAAGYTPVFVDKTAISCTDSLVFERHCDLYADFGCRFHGSCSSREDGVHGWVCLCTG